MKVINTQVSTMFVNAYFYYDENTKEACLIDPGAQADKLMGVLEENELKLKYILLTHGHFDHIGAVEAMRERTGAKVLALLAEKELLENPEYNESLRMMRKPMSVFCDGFLEDGDIIEIGQGQLQVIHTPGHTAGGASYFDKENLVLFSGDTLFKGSVGRADLYSADEDELLVSLEKLKALPDKTAVFSGHGGATTIGYEKETNPYLRG